MYMGRRPKYSIKLLYCIVLLEGKPLLPVLKTLVCPGIEPPPPEDALTTHDRGGHPFGELSAMSSNSKFLSAK